MGLQNLVGIPTTDAEAIAKLCEGLLDSDVERAMKKSVVSIFSIRRKLGDTTVLAYANTLAMRYKYPLFVDDGRFGEYAPFDDSLAVSSPALTRVWSE